MIAATLATHPDALWNTRDQLRQLRRTRLAPPPRLSVSEWADQYRMLSREASAEPGRWMTARAPYQRGIMDAFSDPRVERVVVMSSSQVGKTECLLNVLGYYVDQDPAPILAVFPTISEAEQSSKTRLAPMLRDTPRLRSKVKDPRSRDSGNTLLVKEYPGGHVTMVGANAPSGLAAKPIRVVLADEIDRFPLSAGTEGDPLSLAIRRTANFWNRKIGIWSTPTLKGYSRIEAAFLEGDQRRYYVPCPDCEHQQTLTWGNLKWDTGRPETAAYACESCGVLIGEEHKGAMLGGGEWRASAPFTGTASFHIGALYSPWARWPDLVREWVDVQKDPARLQVFVNTIFGETWEDRAGGLDAGGLASRREGYAADVPAGVSLLTAGVDVQADRLEVVVRGWGHGEETWLVTHEVIPGDTTGDTVWQELDALLTREWAHESGTTMRIKCALVDSGYNAEMVHRFCKPRFSRRVYASRGYSEPGKPLVSRQPSRNNKLRCPVFYLGSDTAKDLLYGRLKVTTPGPHYWHFPIGAGPEYFEQLTSERAVRKQVGGGKGGRGGRWVRRYEVLPNRRNEVVDCEVGNIAALALSGVRLETLGAPLAASAPKIEPEPVPEPIAALVADQAATVKALRRGHRPRGGWVNRF